MKFQQVWRGVAVAVALVLAQRAVAWADPHFEVVIAVDPNGKLVASAGAIPATIRVPPSRFAGIDGYADDAIGFRALDPSEQTESLRPLDAEAQLSFELVYTDPGVTVLGSDGSAPMRRRDLFKLGAAPFDSHPIWILAADVRLPSKVTLRVRDRAAIHDDATILSFTFVPDPTVEAYYCPERCEGAKVYPAPGTCPQCGTPLKLASTARYGVTATPERSLRAGTPTTITIALRDPQGAAVTDLDPASGGNVDVFVVAGDLSSFGRARPTRHPDGTFTLPATFPSTGLFTLFHVFTPPRVGRQVVATDIVVAGPRQDPVVLEPDTSNVKMVDGYGVTLQASAPLLPLREVTLTFSLARDGAPVRDLEPFDGTIGQLAVVSQDRVHFAPLRARAAAGPVTGPDVSFRYVFPVAGLYRLWAQFRRGGALVTVPFTVMVDRPDAPRTRKRSALSEGPGGADGADDEPSDDGDD